MRRALRLIFGLGLLGAGLLLGVGYWNAVQPPVVTRATLAVPGLARAVTVALLSDTHRGWPDMPAGRLNAVVDGVNALGADVILLAGDYSGGKPFEREDVNMEDAVGPFRRLRAPLGVWMVGGNHDSPRWLAWKAARMPSPRLLANAWVDLGPFVLVGRASSSFGADERGAMAGAPAGKPRVMLAHEPEFPEPFAADAPAWTLSGHTHGGQMVLPVVGSVGDLLLSSAILCRRGVCRVGTHRVFVTSGVGTSQIPVRFGVPPEIALLTLTPAPRAARRPG